MAILEYGIGGNEVKVDAAESIANIPDNRSLIVEHLTSEDPISPEAVDGLTTIEEVFAHFSPNIDVEFDTEDGQQVTENFKFSNVGDFGVKNMTNNSPYLNSLNMQKEFYETLTKQLRTNKVLQRVLENAETKEAFIAALSAFRSELTAE